MLNDTDNSATRQGVAPGSAPAVKVVELDPSIPGSGPIPHQYPGSNAPRQFPDKFSSPNRSDGLVKVKDSPVPFTGSSEIIYTCNLRFFGPTGS